MVFWPIVIMQGVTLRDARENISQIALSTGEDLSHGSFNFPPDKMLRVGVVSNPHSGGNRKGLGAVRNILNRHPNSLHREAQTLADTVAVLEEFERNEIDLVAINGGDGTIQTVLTALFFCKPFIRMPLLALLHGGTDSSIAKDAGIRGSRDRGLNKLMNWMDTREGTWEIVRRPIMKVEISSYPQPLYSMIFGAAIIYQAIKFCHQDIYTRGLRGRLATGLTLARYLLGIIQKDRAYREAIPMSIYLDQRSCLKDDFMLVLITTVERLLFGLRPFWGIENAPLHVTLIHARPEHLINVLSLLACGKASRYRIPENGYLSYNASEVRLQVTGGFTLDGELHLPASSNENIIITHGGQASFLRL